MYVNDLKAIVIMIHLMSTPNLSWAFALLLLVALLTLQNTWCNVCMQEVEKAPRRVLKRPLQVIHAVDETDLATHQDEDHSHLWQLKNFNSVSLCQKLGYVSSLILSFVTESFNQRTNYYMVYKIVSSI